VPETCDLVAQDREVRGWGKPSIVVALLAWFSGIALSIRSPLNGDVTYTLGGLHTAGAAGFSAQDIFVARPVAYRFFMAGLEGIRSVFVADGTTFAAQTIIRLGADLFVVAVCVVAYFGLRRHLDRRLSAVLAYAAAVSLTLAPPWHFLQPDWLGVVLSVLCVGAALWPRPWWLGGVLGGLCVMAVVAVKFATAPWAAMALIAVFLLDRRRAIAAGVLGVAFFGAWTLVMNVVLPWENIWLSDQVALVEQSPLNRGVRWSDILHLIADVVDTTIVSPVVMALPAAACALLLGRTSRKDRLWTGGVLLVLAIFSIGSAFGQGEGLMYHFVGVPVFVDAVAGLAFVRVSPSRLPLAVTGVLAVAAGLVLMAQPAQWRLANRVIAAVVVVAVAGVGVLLVVLARRRRAAGATPWIPNLIPSLGAIVLCASLAVSYMPTATYAFSVYDYQIVVGNLKLGSPRAQELRNAIGGSQTPVLYFAFGSVGYEIGNPTPCRYPSPQWLQRSVTIEAVTEMRSFEDNLACMSNDSTAKYLIIDPSWFKVERAPAVVRERVDAMFDARRR
jgi:hypothetical protein